MNFICFKMFALQDMLEALKALSTFFNENSLRSRRNLRSDIERRSLAINEDFITTFQAVKEVLNCKKNCIPHNNWTVEQF